MSLGRWGRDARQARRPDAKAGKGLKGDAAVRFFFQAEDGIRDWSVTGVQTCALPIFDAASFPRVKVCAGWVTRAALDDLELDRSEERRVGKECRSRWSRYD